MQLVAITLQDGRRWAAVMLLAVVMSVFSIWLSSVPASATTGGLIPSPREGFLVPDFSLDTLDGNQITLSDLRGKVVVVNLWTSWC